MKLVRKTAVDSFEATFGKIGLLFTRTSGHTEVVVRALISQLQPLHHIK